MRGNHVSDGRYELGDVVGRGGAADVYRATDVLLGRTVAVKVLRDPTGDLADGGRFAAEARTLAGLDHRCLVTVLDAGITVDRPFLVMELVDGPTLRQLISRREMSAPRLAHVGEQVADALAYVHSRGVLHRDVKPGNVLVGAGDRVKLADFGIARLIDAVERHTLTGHTVGTAAYLAPEQVMGGDLSTAADVYALGLTLLEALTGERAYPGTPTEAAFARITRSPVVPTSLPVPWPRLLTAMTTLDPVQRPSAAEVASALHDVRRASSPAAVTPDPDDTAEQTVTMKPPTPRPAPAADPTATEAVVEPPTARPARSWRTSAALLAGAALLVLAVVLSAGVRGGSSPVGPASGEDNPARPTPTASTPAPAERPVSEVSTSPADQPARTAVSDPAPTETAATRPASPAPEKGPGRTRTKTKNKGSGRTDGSGETKTKNKAKG